MNIIVLISTVFGILLGAGFAYWAATRNAGSNDRRLQQQATTLLDKAKEDAQTIVETAKQAVDQHRDKLEVLRDQINQAKRDDDQRQTEIETTNRQLVERSASLDKRFDELEKRLGGVRQQESELTEMRQVLNDYRQKQIEKLEKIGQLSQADAATKLTEMVERNLKNDLVDLIEKHKSRAQRSAEEQATQILVATMERLASEVTAERTVTTIKLDNEKIKGRVIGKDGRNISAFQRATGVDVLTDDSPNTIVLSSFDPIRREVARKTMEMLINDGRIHPGRIESVVEKAQGQVQKEVVKAAEEASREVGVVGIPPEILQLLGELKFRTSFGQNVLKHSTEMAHLAGVLAAQLGADVGICKYAALVHDLGKALTHKMEGKHHHLSGEMLRKYGVAEAVAHAAEAHHDDVEATTIEAMIIRAVDAISAARPGARNSATDNFIKRMKDLENIATSFPGVERAYVIDAGREVRVFVHPKDLDDLQSIQIARDIAIKTESMMSYPGTIKVVVIRETRAVEYAK